jgi:hypothetical protein
VAQSEGNADAAPTGWRTFDGLAPPRPLFLLLLLLLVTGVTGVADVLLPMAAAAVSLVTTTARAPPRRFAAAAAAAAAAPSMGQNGRYIWAGDYDAGGGGGGGAAGARFLLGRILRRIVPMASAPSFLFLLAGAAAGSLDEKCSSAALSMARRTGTVGVAEGDLGAGARPGTCGRTST